MNRPKISFLIFSHNEARELGILFKQVSEFIENTSPTDELVVVDDYSTTQEMVELLNTIKKFPRATVYQHALGGDFGTHKQWGTDKCTGDYIFQIDADEYVSEILLNNVHEILQMNPTVDLYRIPRVNIVRGITDEDISKWGWRAVQLDGHEGVKVVNWPDYQGRLYRKNEKIRWTRRVHEVIVGAEYVSQIPIDPSLALIHDKTIDRQRKQNEFYMTNFTANENMGRG